MLGKYLLNGWYAIWGWEAPLYWSAFPPPRIKLSGLIWKKLPPQVMIPIDPERLDVDGNLAPDCRDIYCGWNRRGRDGPGLSGLQPQTPQEGKRGGGRGR